MPPSAGSLLITATAERVQVNNLVSDLLPADVPRLFERFWRKEPARSGGLHVGLGLSLARAFAEAMEWTLDARLTSGGILEMTLLAPPPDPAPASASLSRQRHN